MTLSEIKSAVALRGTPWGQPAYSNSSDFTNLINMRLSTWAGATRCWFSHNITLNHSGSAGPFSLIDSDNWLVNSANVALIEVADLYQNDILMETLDYASVSRTMSPIVPAFGAIGSGWIRTDQRTIKLFGTPSASDVIRVEAYYVPPALADSDDNLDLIPGMDEDFVDFVLEEYIRATASGGEQMAVYSDLRAKNEQKVAAWRRSCRVYPKMANRLISSTHIFTPGGC